MKAESSPSPKAVVVSGSHIGQALNFRVSQLIPVLYLVILQDCLLSSQEPPEGDPHRKTAAQHCSKAGSSPLKPDLPSRNLQISNYLDHGPLCNPTVCLAVPGSTGRCLCCRGDKTPNSLKASFKQPLLPQGLPASASGGGTPSSWARAYTQPRDTKLHFLLKTRYPGLISIYAKEFPQRPLF